MKVQNGQHLVLNHYQAKEDRVKQDKPLGYKNYGSIGHLPESRMGPADKSVHSGQSVICQEKARDKHDIIIVQEKLDGSNVGIAKINGEIVALSRAGYLASSSPYEQHHMFAAWVDKNRLRFDFISEGSRLVGEWLAVAHGTMYKLRHEPFVAFDLMIKHQRTCYESFMRIVGGRFITPRLLHYGSPISVGWIMKRIDLDRSYHGATEPIEGAVWRVERKGLVDFLAKFVRHDKVDGEYLGDNIMMWNPVK